MVQMCPAKSIIVPFKKQMYSSGSIILSYKDDKCICVSIHAPTRGATGHDALYVWCRLVSIHAPTRGATENSLLDYQRQRVSIHAPTRGATILQIRRSYIFKRFNPRTHEGCDSLVFFLLHNMALFQSTHPRGVRQYHA